LTPGKLPKLVSKNSIIRHSRKIANLQHDPLVVRRGKSVKGLTANTKQKRTAFAEKNVSTDWQQVMFTDRKKFYFRYPRSVVRNTRWNQKSEINDDDDSVYQPNNPNCFNIYAGITPFGATTVHEVAGSTGFYHSHVNKKGKQAKNITSGQYVEVLVNTLLPQGSVLFGGRSWFLQQDNDPTHRVAQATVSEWSLTHGSDIKLLNEWPPNSPDLSLIENFWSYIECRVNKAGCKTLTEFKECVETEINSKGPGMMKCLDNLYASMPKRISMVLQNNGGKTRY
jgi:hypothetical protein